MYSYTVCRAIASSAPVHHFRDWVSCDYLVKITTNTFARTGSPACTQNIRASWSAIDEFSKSQPGRDYLRAAFGFCEPLTSPENASLIKELFADIYQNLAMINYPTVMTVLVYSVLYEYLCSFNSSYFSLIIHISYTK